MATRAIFTYRDYAALPADGRRHELHDGELSVTPAPAPRHQRVARNLLLQIHAHVARQHCGEVIQSPIDLILSETTVVQPDLVYLEARALGSLTARGIETPPALVAEVLSPGTAQIDRGVKRDLYARHRIAHYWIVDPEARRIEAYELAAEGYRLAAALEGAAPASLPPFADLTLDPAAIWA
jgi:Uma2 family endonuclease